MRTLLSLNPQIYQALESVIMNHMVHYFHDLGLSYLYRIKAMSLITADHLQWFMNNNLKANAGKFHLFLSPHEDQMITVENHVIKSSGVEELLGVTIDSNLNFKEHILSLCKKANRKLHALSLSLAFLNI